MARVERILAVDIGATSIKVGEFEYPAKDNVCLVGFAHREYEEELTEGSRSVVVAGLLRQMLVENRFQATKALVSISGQSAFTRFVRLPSFAEDQARIRQIVEFEARQNVPFPMEEVIWDYQLIASPEGDEMDVMFVVIKNDIVEQMTGAVQAVGLDPLLVDVAPAACYNSARANRIGDEECAMVLNIGGRSANLLFADGNRFFARTIPIAGHTITQQVAKEFGIGFAEAEELKRRHGFVALGGAYAEPESEVAANVSKIIRNVMARLHSEINRSISVYRSQQKGNRPVKLYLTGGSSIMTYTDHFFAEKLRMDVEYLNPFQVVNLGPAVDRQRLEEVAHMFSEVIGLGLRYRVNCPIEVSLVPESIRRQQALRKKKPYLVACMACVVLVLLVSLAGSNAKVKAYESAARDLEKKRTDFERYLKQISQADSAAATKRDQYDSVGKLLAERQGWPEALNELFRLKPPNLWLISLKPITGTMPGASSESSGGGGMGMGMGGEEGMGMGMGMGGGMGSGMGMGMGMGSGMGGMGSGMGGMGGMGSGMGGMGEGMGMGGGGGDVDIVGFEIVGHSVIPKDEIEGAVIPKPEPVAETPPPAEEPAEAADGAIDGTDALGGGADAQLGGGADGEEQPPEELVDRTIPEHIYIASLRKSDIFDGDPEYTRIRRFETSKVVDNLDTFTIMVKLKEPLTFYQVQKATTGMGMMGEGMMGEGGMGGMSEPMAGDESGF